MMTTAHRRAVRGVFHQALVELVQKKKRHEAVESAVVAILEQCDPEMKRERMRERMAMLGLGKKNWIPAGRR